MKKLLSICLTVVMMVSLLAGITVSAESFDYYVFDSYNYDTAVDGATVYAREGTKGVTSSGDPKQANIYDGNYYPGSGLPQTHLVRTQVANFSQDRKVYIKEAGNYKMMALVWYADAPATYRSSTRVNTSLSYTGWNFKISSGEDFDSGEALFGGTSAVFTAGNETYGSEIINDHATYKPEYYWDSSETVYLTAGWHTFNTAAAARGSRMGGVIITNDLTLTEADIKAEGNSLQGAGGTGASETLKYYGSKNPSATHRLNLLDYDDYTAPTWPADAEITASNGGIVDELTSVTLNWSAATDAGVGIAEYELVELNWNSATSEYVEGETLYEGTGTSFTHENLEQAVNYSYRVYAYDFYGQKSVAVDLINHTTGGTLDTTAPGWDETDELTVVSDLIDAYIEWPVANDDRNGGKATSYEVYVGVNDAVPTIQDVVVTAGTDTCSATVAIEPGTTGTIYVVAKDKAGNVSNTEDAEITKAYDKETVEATYTSVEAENNILLRPIHFMANSSEKFWKRQSRSFNGANASPSLSDTTETVNEYVLQKKAVTEKFEDYAQATFYVPEDNEYSLWIYASGTNAVDAYIDSESNKVAHKFHKDGGQTTYTWETSDAEGYFYLTKGWHTIYLNTQTVHADYSGITACYMTTKLDTVPADVAYSETTDKVVSNRNGERKYNIGYLFDNSAPTINVVDGEKTDNSIELTWTTDITGIAPIVYYELYVDDELYEGTGTTDGKIDAAATGITVTDLEVVGGYYDFVLYGVDCYNQSTRVELNGIQTTGTNEDVTGPSFADGAEITAVPGALSYSISWPEAYDGENGSGVSYYEVWQDSVLKDTLRANETSFAGEFDTLGDTIEVEIKVKDKVGNYGDSLTKSITSASGDINYTFRSQNTDQIKGGNIGGAEKTAGACDLWCEVSVEPGGVGRLIQPTSEKPVAIEAYLPAGDYVIFLHAKNTGYGITVSIDGIEDKASGETSATIFGGGTNGKYEWQKGKKVFHIEEDGWVEIELVGKSTNAGVLDMLYITNAVNARVEDLGYEKATATEVTADGKKLNLKYYEDAYGPRISGKSDIVYDEINGYGISLPTVSKYEDAEKPYSKDTNKIKEWRIYVNHTERYDSITDETGSLTEIYLKDLPSIASSEFAEGDVITYKIEAVDEYGNVSVYDDPHANSDGMSVKTLSLVNVSKFEIGNGRIGVSEVEQIEDTVSSKITLSNVASDTGSVRNIRHSIAVYDTTGRIVASDVNDTISLVAGDPAVTSEISADISGITLEPGYKIKAHLWDLDTMVPIATTLEFTVEGESE